MRLLPLLALALLAPCAFAAEEAVAKPAKKAARAGAQFPESVSGVSDEQYAKIRRAIMTRPSPPPASAWPTSRSAPASSRAATKPKTCAPNSKPLVTPW